MSDGFLNGLYSLGHFLYGINFRILFSNHFFLNGSSHFFYLYSLLFSGFSVFSFLTAAHNAHCYSCNE